MRISLLTDPPVGAEPALSEAVDSRSGWSQRCFSSELYKRNTSSSSKLAKCITSARYANKLLLPRRCVLSSRISLRCIKVAPKPCTGGQRVSCGDAVIERDGFLLLGEAVVCFPGEQPGSPPSHPACFAACQASSMAVSMTACSWHFYRNAFVLPHLFCPHRRFSVLVQGDPGPGVIWQTNGGKPACGAARASHRGTSSAVQIHLPAKEEAEIYAPMEKHMLFIRGWHSHTHTLPALWGHCPRRPHCPRCALLFLYQWFMKDVILRHVHRWAVAGVLWETWRDCKCSAETEEMRVCGPLADEHRQTTQPALGQQFVNKWNNGVCTRSHCWAKYRKEVCLQTLTPVFAQLSDKGYVEY